MNTITKRKIQHLQEQINNLKSKINEVLSSPYPFTITNVTLHAESMMAKATFSSKAEDYTYLMLMDGIPIPKIDDIAIRAVIAFEDSIGKITVTDKGDAFKVLATVIEITKKFTSDTSMINRFAKLILGRRLDEDRKIDVIQFTANVKEPSRVKLYKRIAQNVSGYRLVQAEVGIFVLFRENIDDVKLKALKRWYHI